MRTKHVFGLTLTALSVVMAAGCKSSSAPPPVVGGPSGITTNHFTAVAFIRSSKPDPIMDALWAGMEDEANAKKIQVVKLTADTEEQLKDAMLQANGAKAGAVIAQPTSHESGTVIRDSSEQLKMKPAAIKSRFTIEVKKDVKYLDLPFFGFDPRDTGNYVAAAAFEELKSRGWTSGVETIIVSSAADDFSKDLAAGFAEGMKIVMPGSPIKQGGSPSGARHVVLGSTEDALLAYMTSNPGLNPSNTVAISVDRIGAMKSLSNPNVTGVMLLNPKAIAKKAVDQMADLAAGRITSINGPTYLKPVLVTNANKDAKIEESMAAAGESS